MALTNKQKAQKRAQATIAPQRRAEQQSIRKIRNSSRQQSQSYRGAVTMATKAIEGTPLKGLHGIYRQQVAGELASRAATLAESVPSMVASYHNDAHSQIQDARASVPTMGETVQTELEKIRQAEHARTVSQHAKLRSTQADTASTAIAAATKLGTDATAQNAPMVAAQSAAQQLIKSYGIPHTDHDWQNFATELGKVEGVNNADALAIARQLQHKYETAILHGIGVSQAGGLATSGG